MDEKIKDWLVVNGDIVSIADYKKIRDDLLEDYKYIFKLTKTEVVDGVETITPLDIPEYSADYIYNNNLGLIIWNLLTEIKDVYKQHNIQFAKGKYLDKLLGLYNQTRQRQRNYVVQIAITNVVDPNVLIGKNISTSNGYRFQISSFLRTTGLGSDLSKVHYYYMDALSYNEDLLSKDIYGLELLWEEDNLGTFLNENLLILSQRKEESDQAFLSRVNLRSEYATIERELLKINDIESVLILTSDMISSNSSFNPSLLAANELIILIQFREDFYYQSEDVKNSISIDVKVTIQEFLPLGVKGVSQGSVSEWILSSNTIPFTDFLLRTINYYYKQMNRVVITTTISNVYGESLESDLQDLMRELESQDIFTPYTNANSIKTTIEKYWTIVPNSLKSKILIDNARILTDIELENLVVRGMMNGEVVGLSLDINRLPLGLATTTSSLKCKPTITKYKYWLRPDGDYEVVFY